MRLRDLEGEKTVLGWPVSADAAPDDQDSWHNLLSSLIETWAASLKGALDRGSPRAP